MMLRTDRPGRSAPVSHGNIGHERALASPDGAYDLSIVVPTRNEEANVRPLVGQLRHALPDEQS